MTAGRTIGGRYELLNLVGQGSMGSVWRASDLRSRGVVAIKILHSHLAGDRELVRRFEREGRMDVRSPHVVRTLDSGRDCGELFIVMEFVEGTSLKTMLESGALAAERASAIAAQIAAALAAIHARGIIHRDVKPGNILIASDGNTRLSDMGIARVADSTTHTQTGVFLGSLTYAAPETFRGEWDERSDLYSLGVVLYEMLEGNPPFDGDPSRMMDQHRRSAPPELDDLERRFGTLGALVGALMEKQPQDRPRTSAEVAQSLGGGNDERPTIVMPSPGRRRGTGARPQRVAIVVSVGMMAALLVAIIVLASVVGGSGDKDASARIAVTQQTAAGGTATAVAAYVNAVATGEAHASATAAVHAFAVAAATAQAPMPTIAAPPRPAPPTSVSTLPPAPPPPTLVPQLTAEQPLPTTAQPPRFTGRNFESLTDGLVQSSNEITIEARFRTTMSGVIVGYQNGPVGGQLINWVPALYIGTDGLVRGQFWTPETDVSPMVDGSPKDDGRWHTVRISGYTARQELYVDGLLVDSLDGGINHLDMNQNQIGVGFAAGWPASNGAWFYFIGDIEDVRIY